MTIDARQRRHEAAQIRVLRHALQMHEAQFEVIETHPAYSNVERRQQHEHLERLTARHRRDLAKRTGAYREHYSIRARVRHVVRALRHFLTH